jgi:hypothetical protein
VNTFRRFAALLCVATALGACTTMGTGTDGHFAVRYGGPVVPPQPVMSADGPVTSSEGPVMWDGRGVYSAP